jgi:hypothetical protein
VFNFTETRLTYDRLRRQDLEHKSLDWDGQLSRQGRVENLGAHSCEGEKRGQNRELSYRAQRVTVGVRSKEKDLGSLSDRNTADYFSCEESQWRDSQGCTKLHVHEGVSIKNKFVLTKRRESTLDAFINPARKFVLLDLQRFPCEAKEKQISFCFL